MRLTTVTLALALLAASGCGSSTGPKGLPYMELTSASAITDTTNARVADLSIQVRDSSGYTKYKNLTLYIITDVIGSGGASSPAMVFTDADGNVFSNGQEYTDANGRIAVHARLGSVPGTGLIHLSLGGTNSQTVIHVTVTAPPAAAMRRAK
jgi:hypothetical protein